MIEYFSEIAKLVAVNGIDYVVNGRKFKSQCRAFEEKIKRELKFNLEVLDEIIKINETDCEQKKEKISALLPLLKTKTFDEIDAGIIPIKEYFPKKIEISPDNEYRHYLKYAKTLSDLIEKVYARIQITSFQFIHGTVSSNFEYVKKLILLSLKEL